MSLEDDIDERKMSLEVVVSTGIERLLAALVKIAK